ncbi:MAG: hypothetical protein GX624_05535 [Actinobacteria bacterium]|nr:hypothetical protein [Actinomycetota bacterium]
MATIGETIDLHVPLPVARQKWYEYVNGMIIGSGAGPGEREHPLRWRKKERDADEGDVQFAAVDDATTRLTVTLQFPQGDDEIAPDADQVERLRSDLRGDLDLFRRFTEGRLREAA